MLFLRMGPAAHVGLQIVAVRACVGAAGQLCLRFAESHSAVKLNIGQIESFVPKGFIRSHGERDACLNRLLHASSLLTLAH